MRILPLMLTLTVATSTGCGDNQAGKLTVDTALDATGDESADADGTGDTNADGTGDTDADETGDDADEPADDADETGDDADEPADDADASADDDPGDSADEGYPRGGNMIVIFMDDVGLDKIGAYGAHPSPAHTPTINRLASEGVLFTRAYSNPTCSPSRSTLLTGRHGKRTGMGRWLYLETAPFDLRDHEVTIAEHLGSSPHGYTSAVTGKWHLSSFVRDDSEFQPLRQGFDYHAGAMGNPQEAVGSGHTPRHYFNWEKSTNGSLEWTDTYMTTDTANEASAAMERMSPPWLLYVPFNAPHEPLHRPPEELLSSPLPEPATDIQLFDAMIEAMDTEINRIIENIPADQLANTTVFVIGDNGTPSFGIAEPWPSTKSKGSTWEAGVHVPLVVWGQHARHPGTTVDELVHLVDIFSTMADIAEVDPSEAVFTEGPWDGEPVTIDGQSVLPFLYGDEPDTWKTYLYTEGFYPDGEPPYTYHKRMVRDRDWKYSRHNTGEAYMEWFHRYGEDYWTEGDNLLLGPMDEATTAAYHRLQDELLRWDSDVHFGP
jgi:arylsulfatase A-like enzyme